MAPLQLDPTVAEALESGRPIVALESALITHGFLPPGNLEIARRLEGTVRAQGAVPATVGVLDGKPHIGMSSSELSRLASPQLPRPTGRSAQRRKISLRDLPLAVAQGASGGTTVAATMHLAYLAGLGILATGGIGGVHRGYPADVSADLTALETIGITVVCSGAKAILDLLRTRENLETRGIPVIGYGTDVFPAFYSRYSELAVDAAADTAEEVVRMAQARTALGLSGALLVCVPVPKEMELPHDEADELISQALHEAQTAGVRGADLTPFLLARVVELSDGRARQANEALLVNNARVAAAIARAATGV